jgi:lipoprotein-releasing system permease protein
VLVLVVVTSVMTGFGETLREKIMTMTPHLWVDSDAPIEDAAGLVERIEKDPGVVVAAPSVRGNAVLEYAGRLYGVRIEGVSFPEVFEVVRLEQYLRLGSERLEAGEILIGTELAKNLGAVVGDRVKIRSPGGARYAGFPGEIDFRIRGIYESGLYDYDAHHTFITLSDARKLYGFQNEVHGIAVAARDPDAAARLKERLLEELPDSLALRTWIENNRAFFAALRTEKNVMFVLMAFAVLIAALNIVSTLVMLVMEKVRDIGILKTIGFTRTDILGVFLIKGVLIGMLGTALGAAGGVLFVRHIDSIEQLVARATGYEVFPDDVYYFDHIPARLVPRDLALIAALALFVSILASLYPALKASRLSTIEAIRHE